MQNQKTVIITQIFITLMMASLMTGIFSFFELGFTQVWLQAWLSKFIVAWPIAFILSLFVGKIGFSLATKLTA